MQHTNTSPQARVSERNPLDFIPNITQKQKTIFNMTIIELIKQIKPIPELFIRKHSIFSLEVFIDGWYYRDEDEDVKADILYTDFYEWLRKRYNMNDSRGWADILLYIFKTEEEALIQFFILFNIFYKETYGEELW